MVTHIDFFVISIVFLPFSCMVIPMFSYSRTSVFFFSYVGRDLGDMLEEVLGGFLGASWAVLEASREILKALVKIPPLRSLLRVFSLKGYGDHGRFTERLPKPPKSFKFCAHCFAILVRSQASSWRP